MSRPLNLYHTCIYIVICVTVVTCLPLYHKSGNVKHQLCVNTTFRIKLLKLSDTNVPTNVSPTTGAPKLINSDLFLEKRATVPIKTQGVQRLSSGKMSTF